MRETLNILMCANSSSYINIIPKEIMCQVSSVTCHLTFHTMLVKTAFMLKPLEVGWKKTYEASLRRLQAQTLPDGTPPVGKIHTFRKIAVNF